MNQLSSRTTEGRGRSAPKHVRLYVKAEFFNRASSVEDRLAIRASRPR